MLKIIKAASLGRLAIKQRFLFSDVWKERDQAAQKVYISKSQRETMKKLLNKMNKTQQDHQNQDNEFQRRLDQIFSRYKITNQSFKAQVINLHKQL